MLTADQIIEMLDLRPLPFEGGYYRETYRSTEVIPRQALPARFSSARSALTAIYYLLTPTSSVSAMHRLPTDEMYHFYAGDPVEMLQLYPDGRAVILTLGGDLAAGQRVQAMVPAGVWQGSRLSAGGGYALMGVTVAPGFDMDDYQAAGRATLLSLAPQEAELIRVLTPDGEG